MATSLVETRAELIARSNQLDEIFREAGETLDMAKITSIHGDSAAKAAEIKRRNDELSALGQELDRLENLANIGRVNSMQRERMTTPVTGLPMPGSAAEHQQAVKSLRQILEDDPGLKAFRKSGRPGGVEINLDGMSLKTLITLSDISPQNQRDGLVNMALEERTIADLMGQSTTTANTIEYYEETTVTNNAATVLEGGTKPESALGWTLRTENVRKIATGIPATRESLDDIPQLEGEMRNRLAFMVVRVEEAQLLNGNGTAPNIRGILQRSGIQTQAKGADPTPDAIYKGIQKVRGSAGFGFAEPTAVVMHPDSWTPIRLLRTADGIYIYGNPSEPGFDTIFGKTVRQTTAISAGTAIVGAFRPYAEVVRREGITITVSTEHSTFFVENKVLILAEERLTLKVTRPAAFATITGI